MTLRLVPTWGGGVEAVAVNPRRSYSLFGIESSGLLFYPGPYMGEFLVSSGESICYRVTDSPINVPLVLPPNLRNTQPVSPSEVYRLKWIRSGSGVMLRVIRPDGSLPRNGNLIAIDECRQLTVIQSSAWAALGVPADPRSCPRIL